MRLFRWMLILAAPAIAACSGVMEPPSGLPVDLAETGGPPVPSSVSIVGAGDSVIATVILPLACGTTTTAAAALSQGQLIITLVFTYQNLACLAANGSATYTLTVHKIPPGRYTAIIHEWSVTNNVPVDDVLGTSAIALP